MAGKLTTEDARRIDIRYLKQQGLLRVGASGVLRWHRGGEQTGSVGFSIDDGVFRLRFRYQDPATGQWVPHVQEVTIERTRCNFGGTRPWFRCPGCERRVAVLYGVFVEYLCRHCYDLSYGSQQEREMDRILRRAREIRKRLGASENLMEPIDEKPKGMHWKTFDKLVAEEEYWNSSYDEAVVLRYGF